ncbi:hypothetical protein NsoK4_03505 [Nitrosopumilus sp. K4]|uniref:hypothetical protein n=1 Tax=Nitrosopumilus sp. K4 TaxID=2795383 RepID=UPI001BAA1E69|nr:hypothetical protein [Nitrosopumilus sp. K4]QUC65324.1 hypothetical protein NsoK4_03505 [Nitrosopumilus sp. K4]
MVDYRADLLLNIQKNIRKSYTRLYEQYPIYGIFNKSTQKKLLQNIEHDQEKYGSQSWSNLRKSVHRSLIDISLFCNIASSDQLEKTMFGYAEVPELNSTNSSNKHLLPYIISSILNPKQYQKTDIWKMDLSNRILSEVFEFYRESNIVKSKAYLRLLEEVEDFLKLELESRYRNR